jgi:hypothetical protein
VIAGRSAGCVPIGATATADGEVSEATVNSELIVRREGRRQVRREVKICNPDMILAVGYRVTTPGRSSSGSGRRPF